MSTKSFFVFSFFTLIIFLSHAQSATIAGFKTGDISKDSLILTKIIEIDAPFKIYSFVMIYFANGTTKEFKGLGNIISKEMREVIKGSKSGERFSFEQINAIGSDGIVYRLKPVMLKLK